MQTTMSEAGIRAYRRDVVTNTPCPDCRQPAGDKCVKITARRPTELQMDYVHDGRSYRHHVDALFRQQGTENPYV